ncbi:F-box protein At4g35930 isoform X2 [Elaeis guineensis]|uniref:F-box protein At4g35930 isoform X2 n=1 Tax=Elaeis guineensis var. tenera TaxID=51953 RepID=A0A6I9R5N9_ELAGV|nr:F-box protein At4g35930 isoform X2 [Elaeis guineensis]
MSPKRMAFKQKKRVKNACNKYLKPRVLAQLGDGRTTTRSCADIGKKWVVLDSEKAKLDTLHHKEVTLPSDTPVASPIRFNSQKMVDGNKQQKLPGSPKTPEGVDYDNESRLESLPMDLLVLQARQLHFNYTTPDRSRQEMLSAMTPLPTEHWPFVSKGDGNAIQGSTPHTPKAPRHGPRPPRLRMMDMKQIAAVLFQESVLPSRRMVPPGLPRPAFKPVASSRVLFCEDELCQAVAQNKLR